MENGVWKAYTKNSWSIYARIFSSTSLIFHLSTSIVISKYIFKVHELSDFLLIFQQNTIFLFLYLIYRGTKASFILTVTEGLNLNDSNRRFLNSFIYIKI